MKYFYRNLALLIVVTSLSLAALSSQAQTPASTTQTVLMEVQVPGSTDTQPHGWWATIRQFLGARSVVLRPEPGTKLLAVASAYAPSPYQTDSTPCITAAGTVLRDREIVASNFLPLGTVLKIKTADILGDTSKGEYTYLSVEDRMNRRYDLTNNGGRKYLDIAFASTKQARQFGRQTSFEVEIVAYGSPGQDLSQYYPDKKEVAEVAPTPEPSLIERVGLRSATVVETLTHFLPASVRSGASADVDCTKFLTN